MFYHPGKIIEVYCPKEKNVESADESVQATIEMWDENLFTLSVKPILGKKIKINDVVLVDWSHCPRKSLFRNKL